MQEAEDYSTYQQALAEQQKGELEAAENLYLQLLQSPVIRCIRPVSHCLLNFTDASFFFRVKQRSQISPTTPPFLNISL
jgi:hypothetical protein